MISVLTATIVVIVITSFIIEVRGTGTSGLGVGGIPPIFTLA